MKPFWSILLLFLSACGSPQDQLWRWTLEGRCYADPVIDQNTVFIASSAGEIIAGNYRTGDKQWGKKVGGPTVAAPAVFGNILFVATQNGFVQALEKTTGKEIWKREFPDDGFEASPTPADGTLFVPSRTGNLYALSSNNGKIIWQHEGNRKYNVRVLVSGSHLLIGGWANDFFCFTKSGKVHWQFRAPEPIVEEAVVHRNIVYFATLDNFLYALDIPSGRFLWKVNLPFPKNPTIVNDELIFASRNQLVVLRPEDGKPVRKITLDKSISRLYGNQHSMIFSGDAYRIDFSSGAKTLLLDAPVPIFKVAFAPGTLIAVDELYAVFASGM